MFLYNNPFIASSIPSFEEGGDTPLEETIYADHDDAYDYKMIDGIWYTQKKGDEEWLSLEDNEEATTKLNTAYPDAITVDNTTKTEESTDTKEIEEANKKVEEGTDAVFYDEEFRSPEEANLLSGIGDTGLFDLIKAIDTTVGSFKKENYYDPGTKADYSKFSHTNTTDQDMYLNFDALAKGKKTGDVLMDEEQGREHYMQKFLDDRHKRNPDKYAKVKNYEEDLYRKTGYNNYRKGPWGLFKGEGKEGDLLEQKYSDASHIGWSADKMGNYGNAFDYLTQNPDDPTKLDAQDFDDGFGGIPFDPNNPDNYNYSEEYLNSAKHNPNLQFGQYDPNNSIINQNFMGDDRFSKVDKRTYYDKFGYPNTPESADFKPHIPGEDTKIDNTNPEEVIAANDKLREQEALRRQQEEQAKMIEDQLRKSQGKRYGGSLPTAQTGLGWLDSAIATGGNIYDQTKNIVNTGIKRAGITSIAPYIGSTAASILGVGSSALGLLDGNLNLHNTISDANPDKDKNEIKSNVDMMYDGVYGSSHGHNSFYGNMKQTGGESLQKAQFGLGNDYGQGMFADKNSGYNPLTNNMDTPTFNTDFSLQQTPWSLDMFAGMEQPPEKTEPFFSSADNMYAMNQSVNRSMDSFDAFTSDMNNRLENPSLSFNQVDTNPLSLPDFKIDEDLSNQIQMNQDKMAFKTAREDGRVIGNTIIPTKRESRKSIKEFGNKLDDQMDNFPKYKGKRKHVKELEKANELGFDDRNEYLDYVQDEKEEKINRDLTRDQLNEDNKDANPSFGDKLWNAKNRVLDSKPVQTYSKLASGAVRIAKPLNRMLEQAEEEKQKKLMAKNAYLSDNMWAANDADLTGSKGDYDVNSGIFRPDDKVVPGTTMTKYGGSFSTGGEIEIDMNTYKQLVSAGARIEIL